MNDTRFTKDTLPNITRPDARFVLISQWQVAGSQLQRKAVDAAMQVWERFAWPEGLLSYACYLGTDNQTILHYSQWSHEEAHRQFLRNDPPERLRLITEAVPIARTGIDAFRLYRSIVADTPAKPGCIVIVREAFERPDITPRWIDAVLVALAAEESPPEGGISGHFHISTDGLRMVNYAEWVSAQAHQNALNKPGEAASDRSLLWQTVRHFPGRKNTGSVERYHFYRSIISH
jgi:quinol monooxygenase YgiN